MKMKVIPVLLLLLFISLCVYSQGKSSKNNQQDVNDKSNVTAQKLYDQIDQSWANHDVNQLLGFYDPSFTAVDTKGKRIGFAAFRKLETDLFDNAKLRNFNRKTTIKDVQLEAGRMVVYYGIEMHFQYQDQQVGWESLIDTASSEATWQKMGDQW
ncbi:MAG: hypothetical protein J2P41_17920, partial [Blastocatellia bacterium]|nr:hypothetical protein [Blastocatellia bacterium]